MRAATILMALAILLAPIPAGADDSGPGSIPPKARLLAARGRKFHDAGDYVNAIAAFTQAYVIAPSPALLFNLAQAYRLQGNCDDAAIMYRRYLATDPTPSGRVLAEAHLANVERCLHKLALHIPVETASLAASSSSTAMTTTATASAPTNHAQLEEDIGIGLTLGGGVALAIAGYYAVQAHDASNDVAAAYAKGAKWTDVAATDSRGKSAATNAKIFGAGGALGVAGGIVMYLVGKHTEHNPVTVVATGHGVEVGMLWAF